MFNPLVAHALRDVYTCNTHWCAMYTHTLLSVTCHLPPHLRLCLNPYSVLTSLSTCLPSPLVPFEEKRERKDAWFSFNCMCVCSHISVRVRTDRGFGSGRRNKWRLLVEIGITLSSFLWKVVAILRLCEKSNQVRAMERIKVKHALLRIRLEDGQ